MSPVAKPKPFRDLIPAPAAALISATNSEIIRVIGGDAIRTCVLDVLSGRNLRDSTEPLTRRRISALNLTLLNLFVRGLQGDRAFAANLPRQALDTLSGRASKAEKIVARWLLGLTEKGVQNVLRDSPDDLANYATQYAEVCAAVLAEYEATNGKLGSTFELKSADSRAHVEVDGLAILYLLNAIGAQTLTTRGSEKSAYGKLFEKLVLGALLTALGFVAVSPPAADRPLARMTNVFWLTTQDEKRESDATLLVGPGKGVRFDLGFIGRGNPEISLDKVTRFGNTLSVGGKTGYAATVILVDRIGEGSSIQELATELGGDIVQMSGGYWPQRVAQILHDRVGYKIPKGLAAADRVREYLEKHVPGTAELLGFVGV